MGAKKYSIAILILFIVFISSCSKNNTTSNENTVHDNDDDIIDENTIYDNDDDIIDDNTEMSQDKSSDMEFDLHYYTGRGTDASDDGPKPRTYSEMTNLYEDYNIITYINDMFIIKNEVLDEINQYLIDNGSEYVVWMTVTNDLMGYLTGDNKADIVYSGFIDFYYDEMVQQGLLIPFDDYLQSEEGKSLYESLPTSNWMAMDRQGSIYGINGYSTAIISPPSYTVNRELMRKYNLTEEDLNRPLGELKSILKTIDEGESSNSNFSVISAEIDYQLSGLYNVSNAVVLNEVDDSAYMLLEDDSYLQLLRDLFECYKEGLIDSNRVSTECYDDFFVHVSFNGGLPFKQPGMGMFKDKEGYVGDTEDLAEIILDGYLYYNASTSFANGISVTSENPEYAFDFIKKVYTDSYLTNLFFYGIEGTNYIFDNGKVSDFHPSSKLLIGNDYISHPTSYEFLDKGERYYSIKEEAKESLYKPHMFDLSGLEEQILETNLILKTGLSELLQGEVLEFDNYINQLKDSLYEQGIQDIIDEVNRQLGFEE